MKKLLIALSIAYASLGFAQTNVVATTNAITGWVAPISVQTTATGFRHRSTNIITPPNAPAMAVVTWEWIDAKGNVVRNGVTRYEQKVLEPMLASKGFSVEMIKALFLSLGSDEAVAPAK